MGRRREKRKREAVGRKGRREGEGGEEKSQTYFYNLNNK